MANMMTSLTMAMDYRRQARKNKKAKREERFEALKRVYEESPLVKKMAEFMQHGKTTTLAHSEMVAHASFFLNSKLHLKANEEELMAACMLHDFYLYDYHDGSPCRRTHGFDHPNRAADNAVKYFDVSPKAESSIRSHMWPLTITTVPKSKEAAILCIADKYCAIAETFNLK